MFECLTGKLKLKPEEWVLIWVAIGALRTKIWKGKQTEWGWVSCGGRLHAYNQTEKKAWIKGKESRNVS